MGKNLQHDIITAFDESFFLNIRLLTSQEIMEVYDQDRRVGQSLDGV